MQMKSEKVLKEFQKIPGVGKAISQDLYDLGFRSIKEFQGKDPEELYLDLCEHQNTKVCRCMLYVFRLVVYFSENTEYDPELLKWQNWKD